MQPLISIIMPVYNTGAILNKTVDSIVNQTFADFELIIIDDGSNVETAKLCDLFLQRDARIKVIHKENGGTCAARNLGIDIAMGEYVTFCDHDDIYDARILEEEINLINQDNRYAMAIVGAIHTNDNEKKERYGRNIALANKHEVEENTAKIWESGILETVWNILYRKELIGETRFNEDLKKGHEDVTFNIEIYQKASSLIAVDEILYFHYIRKSMSTSARYHEESIDAIKIANDKICEMCNRVINKINKDDYVKLQGKYIKIFTTYLIHLGKTFEKFKNKSSSLCYVPVRFSFGDFLKNMSKNSLCFYCLSHNKVRLLYYLIKMNNQLKKEKE